MSENRRWINFGKYSSPPMGKGKILDCVETMEGLYIKMTLNGVLFEGILPLIISEEEE
mgnify:FL=1|tara:strand:+ start:4227 stop:4400 length:174 start_codon:yes stop_codon:yes gene_type:complete